jgi:hypothetical protein
MLALYLSGLVIATIVVDSKESTIQKDEYEKRKKSIDIAWWVWFGLLGIGAIWGIILWRQSRKPNIQLPAPSV